MLYFDKIFKRPKTPLQLASKYNVSINKVQRELELGTNVEMEHTHYRRVARIIALHHLQENLNYYRILKKAKL
jgi:hypothetical protein